MADTHLRWVKAPHRTEWGADTMEALVALGKDHTLRLYADVDAVGLVAPALLASSDSELAALRKDAERYRWLREQGWWDGPLVVVRNPKEAIKLGHDAPSLHRLDAAIDAAMRGAT